jgi:chromosomal replication initiation ATPase DnaA
MKTAHPLLPIILETISDVCNLPINDLKSSKQTKELRFCRRLYMYTAREILDQSISLEEIGKFINRGHTAVYESVNLYKEMLDNKEVYPTFIFKKVMDIVTKIYLN